MDNIFNLLNNLNDEELWIYHNILTGKNVLEDAEIIIVEDARIFDTQPIIDNLALDHRDEEYLEEAYDDLDNTRIIISESDVRYILNDIASCEHIKISKYWKTRKFQKTHNLSNEDLRNIVHQLTVGDYSYSLISKNEDHEGVLLAIFITDKKFKLSENRYLENLMIYIKIDPSKYGVVCAVSVHEPLFDEGRPYAKIED